MRRLMRERHNALMLQGDDQRQTIVTIQRLFQLTLSLTPCQRQSCFNAHGAFPERSISLKDVMPCSTARQPFSSVPVPVCWSGLPVLCADAPLAISDVMPG